MVDKYFRECCACGVDFIPGGNYADSDVLCRKCGESNNYAYCCPLCNGGK